MLKRVEVVAVVGSREWERRELGPSEFTRVWNSVDEYVRSLPVGSMVVTGGAAGVDARAEQSARTAHSCVTVYLPRPGESPLARNARIARHSARMVAFWNGTSRGTLRAVACAHVLGHAWELRNAAGDVLMRSSAGNCRIPLGDYAAADIYDDSPDSVAAYPTGLARAKAYCGEIIIPGFGPLPDPGAPALPILNGDAS